MFTRNISETKLPKNTKREKQQIYVTAAKVRSSCSKTVHKNIIVYMVTQQSRRSSDGFLMLASVISWGHTKVSTSYRYLSGSKGQTR